MKIYNPGLDCFGWVPILWEPLAYMVMLTLMVTEDACCSCQ